MAASMKTLLLVSTLVVAVTADYHIGWSLLSYSADPDIYLATNGTCCELDCTPCTPVLRFCFRESGHSHDDTETCSLEPPTIRNSPTFFLRQSSSAPNVAQPFDGSFQVYVRVAHDGNIPPSFDPNDPLIDSVFFEFTGIEATSVQPVIMDQIGDFERVTLRMSATVNCAEGFNGSDCSTFCEEIDGTVICSGGEAIATTTTTSILTERSTTSTTEPFIASTDMNTSGDNTTAIAVGVSIAGILVILLIVGAIVGAAILVRKCHSGTMTSYYTVKRAGSSSPNDDKGNVRTDSQPASQAINIEDMYSTVNKKGKNPPPLPPAYVPDENDYQNVNSQQGDSGVVYENTRANGNKKKDSLNYTDVSVTTPTSHVNHDVLLDNDEFVSYSQVKKD